MGDAQLSLGGPGCSLQGPYPASSADGEPEAQVAIVGPGLGARVRTASGPGGFERLLGLVHPSSTDFGSRTP